MKYFSSKFSKQKPFDFPEAIDIVWNQSQGELKLINARMPEPNNRDIRYRQVTINENCGQLNQRYPRWVEQTAQLVVYWLPNIDCYSLRVLYSLFNS